MALNVDELCLLGYHLKPLRDAYITSFNSTLWHGVWGHAFSVVQSQLKVLLAGEAAASKGACLPPGGADHAGKFVARH